MSFTATIRKYERVLLLILVIVTAMVFTVTYECSEAFRGTSERDYAGEFYYSDEKVLVPRDRFLDMLSRWKAAKNVGGFFAMGDMDALSRSHVWTLYQEYRGGPSPLWRWVEPKETPNVPGEVATAERVGDDERLRKTMWALLVTLDICRRNGISVSDNEVRDYIAKTFQAVMGRDEQNRPLPFDPQAYVAILRSQMDLDPGSYEQTIREYLTFMKLRRAIQDAVVVKDEEVFDEFVEKHRQALVRAVKFDPTSFKEADVRVSDAALIEHFRATQSRYMQPKMMSFEYAFAHVDDVKSKVVNPTEDELKLYYEGHKEEQYKIEEPPAPPKDPNKPGSEENADGQPPAVQPQPKYKPFEEVREDVVKRWLERRAKEECLSLVMNFLRKLEEAMLERDITLAQGETPKPIDLAPLATQCGMRYGLTRLIPDARIMEFDNVFGKADSWQPVLKASTDRTTERIPTSNGYVVLRLKEELPERYRLFVPELHRKVETDFRRTKCQEAARADADAFHGALIAEVNKKLEEAGLTGIPEERITEEQRKIAVNIKLNAFDDIVALHRKDVLKPPFAKSSESLEEFSGRSSAIISVALKCNPGEYRLDAGQPPFYVWQALATRPPKSSEYETVRQSIRDSRFESTARSFIGASETALVEEAKVVDYSQRDAKKRAEKTPQ
ncbi:MAG: hypothetical protein RDV41_03525 [Planctomycetota bacterium]|nr:hypothetical protein [Planctomycetota bacterium]